MDLESIYQLYKASGREQVGDFARTFFAPILIDPPDGWSEAHHRVAVVGQETGSWNFSPENANDWGYEWDSEESIYSLADFLNVENSVSLLQKGYRSFGFASDSYCAKPVLEIFS